MKSTVDSTGTIALQRSRILDYITLMKPELTLLSVATALASSYMAAIGEVPIATMLHVFVGTILVGGGAGALNQYLERDYDGLMRRTENRPLPAGRLDRGEVLLFGAGLTTLGVIYLAISTNVLTVFLAILTFTSYLFLYTPLKRITPYATVVGGIPGALPPLMGWTAVRNDLSADAWILFAILFMWQMPHFYSLAWMYRKDYARAGYPMLTVIDPGGKRTGRQIVLYCSTLIPVSLLLSLSGMTGLVYGAAALMLGTVFLLCAIHLHHARSNALARRVFVASLLYLPALFIIMTIDKL